MMVFENLPCIAKPLKLTTSSVFPAAPRKSQDIKQTPFVSYSSLSASHSPAQLSLHPQCPENLAPRRKAPARHPFFSLLLFRHRCLASATRKPRGPRSCSQNYYSHKEKRKKPLASCVFKGRSWLSRHDATRIDSSDARVCSGQAGKRKNRGLPSYEECQKSSPLSRSKLAYKLPGFLFFIIFDVNTQEVHISSLGRKQSPLTRSKPLHGVCTP